MQIVIVPSDLSESECQIVFVYVCVGVFGWELTNCGGKRQQLTKGKSCSKGCFTEQVCVVFTATLRLTIKE